MDKIYNLLRRQEETMRELHAKVDSVNSMIIALRAVIVLMATEPEALAQFSGKELTELMLQQEKKVRALSRAKRPAKGSARRSS